MAHLASDILGDFSDCSAAVALPRRCRMSWGRDRCFSHASPEQATNSCVLQLEAAACGPGVVSKLLILRYLFFRAEPVTSTATKTTRTTSVATNKTKKLQRARTTAASPKSSFSHFRKSISVVRTEAKTKIFRTFELRNSKQKNKNKNLNNLHTKSKHQPIYV